MRRCVEHRIGTTKWFIGAVGAHWDRAREGLLDRISHVVRFAATIGQRDSLVTTRSIFSAMPPDHHPAEGRTIDIELIGSERKDHEEVYWTEQNENLERLFARKIKERIEQREIRQLSVFALASFPISSSQCFADAASPLSLASLIRTT